MRGRGGGEVEGIPTFPPRAATAAAAIVNRHTCTFMSYICILHKFMIMHACMHTLGSPRNAHSHSTHAYNARIISEQSVCVCVCNANMSVCSDITVQHSPTNLCSLLLLVMKQRLDEAMLYQLSLWQTKNECHTATEI